MRAALFDGVAFDGYSDLEGLDLGVSFARNIRVSFGYNFTGFNDRDFSAARYTDRGPFIKLRVKADQDTFKDLGFDLRGATGP